MNSNTKARLSGDCRIVVIGALKYIKEIPLICHIGALPKVATTLQTKRERRAIIVYHENVINLHRQASFSCWSYVIMHARCMHTHDTHARCIARKGNKEYGTYA